MRESRPPGTRPNDAADAGNSGALSLRLSRWTAWADSLIDRYGWARQAAHSPDMTLAYPFTTIKVFRERWLATRENKPRFDLYIQPILTVFRQDLLARLSNYTDVRNETLSGFSGPALTAGSQYPKDHPPGPTEERLRFDRKPASNAGDQHAGTAGLLMAHQPPNLTFLERTSGDPAANPGYAKEVMPRARFAGDLVQRTEALARQLVSHTRRIERSVEGISTRTLAAKGALSEQQPRSTNTTMDGPAARAAATAGVDQVLPATAQNNTGRFDVDQLTDRVLRELDRRVIGVRERFGRI